jgi:hypothetical protein
MLWLKTIGLFIIHYSLFIILMEVYARSLFIIAKLPPLFKNIFTIVSYLLTCLSMVGLYAFVNYAINVDDYSDIIYFKIFYYTLLVISTISAGLYFHRKYINKLQKYGYFK